MKNARLINEFRPADGRAGWQTRDKLFLLSPTIADESRLVLYAMSGEKTASRLGEFSSPGEAEYWLDANGWLACFKEYVAPELPKEGLAKLLGELRAGGRGVCRGLTVGRHECDGDEFIAFCPIAFCLAGDAKAARSAFSEVTTLIDLKHGWGAMTRFLSTYDSPAYATKGVFAKLAAAIEEYLGVSSEPA